MDTTTKSFVPGATNASMAMSSKLIEDIAAIDLISSSANPIVTEVTIIEDTVCTGLTTVAVNTALITSRFTNLGGETPLLMAQAVQTGGKLFDMLSAIRGEVRLAIDTQTWRSKLSKLTTREVPTASLGYIKQLSLGGNSADSFLRSVKASVPGIVMLVIDNLEAFLPNSAGNNDKSALKTDLAALHEAAIDNEIAVVAVQDIADIAQNTLRKRVKKVRGEVFTTMISIMGPSSNNTLEFKVSGSFGKGKYKHNPQFLSGGWRVPQATTSAAPAATNVPSASPASANAAAGAQQR